MDLSKSRAALERAEADLEEGRKLLKRMGDSSVGRGKLVELELEISKVWTQVELLETERS
jgi:hypothetical protein